MIDPTVEKTELTAAEYVALSARTESVGDEHTNADRLCHSALGLLTEIAEYNAAADRANRVEELGDAMWYLAVLVRVQGHDDFSIFGEPPPADEQSIIAHVAVVADAAKRWKFYGLEPKWADVNYAAGYIYHALIFGAFSNNVSAATLWASNIHKLRARYPAKFTAEKAAVRDTQQEMTAVLGIINKKEN